LKVAYPHMGYLSIAVNNMLTNLGVEVIEAPPITKRTVELGSLYSPEGVCLPYKINLGNFLESIDRGADTLINVCGAGKCRLGFYNAVQKIQLEKRKELQFYTLDTNNFFRDLYHLLQKAACRASRLDILKNIALAVKSLKALDAINSAKNFYGARSTCPEEIIHICNDTSKQFTGLQSFNDVNNKQNAAIDLIRACSGPAKSKPAKIGLVGEFYVLLEPYVNHMIEDILVKQGIEVKKFVYTGDWAYSNSLLRSLGIYNEEKAYLDQAKPYLHHHVGGDGLKSVGSALWCAHNEYDGIIHIYPFGCMPEVVAQYALKNVAADHNLPLLSLSLDEHSSDVGIITRLEAFADCITRNK
jgi:predicted nucleotide-binding protein (sugar kinase/HSP70/actin superfamily)